MRFGKVGEALDWVERAKLVFDIVVAIGSGKLVKKLLSYIPQISHDWASVIAWAVAAVVLFCLIAVFQRGRQPRLDNQSTRPPSDATIPAISTVVAGLPGPNFDSRSYFKYAYYSPLTAEAEKNIRIVAEQNQKNDPAGFMAKLIGVGLVGFLYELTWAYIYRSQLLMLIEMNRNAGWLSVHNAKAFYDRAAVESPEVYAKYSYEQWLGFMKAQGLILQHPSDMLEITVRGKDFLKYLTHWGYDASARKG